MNNKMLLEELIEQLDIENKDDEIKELYDQVLQQIHIILDEYLERFNSENKNKLSYYNFGEREVNSNYQYVVSHNIVVSYKVNKVDILARKNQNNKKKRSLYQQITQNYSDGDKNIKYDIEIAKELFNYLKVLLNNEIEVNLSNNQIIIEVKEIMIFCIMVCYEFDNSNINAIKFNGGNWNYNHNEFLTNFDKKQAKTNNRFIKIIQVIKAIDMYLMYIEKSVVCPSLVLNFIENLIYNVKDNLFLEGSDYEVLCKVINYLNNHLSNNDLNEFVVMDNNNQKMFNTGIYEKNMVLSLMQKFQKLDYIMKKVNK